jgi:glucose/arabinose dehydrogenase
MRAAAARALAAGLALALSAFAASCADRSADGSGRAHGTTYARSSAGTSSPSSVGTSAPTVGGDPRVSLHEVATLDEPLAMATRHGSDDLYVAERGGRVWAMRHDGDRLAKDGDGPVLDLGDVVDTGYLEQGLLGLAFSPDGAQLFVDYVARGPGSGTTKVVRYDVRGGRAVPSSATELFSLRQPHDNHNGGNLVIGPDGRLYVGLGDGGSQGDPDDHGQDRASPFAKILRMELDGSHRVTWAMGLRNPWRFSFDAPTGDLWIGDVGGSEREEVDHLRGGGPTTPGGSGANLGWSLREGTVDTGKPGDRHGLTDPVHEYGHDRGGCSIVGGFVYRGSAVPGLAGRYVFGDYCQPQLRALDPAHPASATTIAEGVEGLASFGQDTDGELYALSLRGPIYRLAPRT